jgi:hypothetical protein
MPFRMQIDMQHPEPERALEEFTVDRPGAIILVGHHLSTATQIRCLIRTISLAGATLDVNRGVEIPNHFFLEILGIRDQIGCTLIKRDANLASVSFNMLINPEFLHHVQRLNFEAGQ